MQRISSFTRQLFSAPSSSSSSSFIRCFSSVPKSRSFFVGNNLDRSLNLSQSTIGQTIEVPYETTVGDSYTGLWNSTFQIHDRLFTSAPFAQQLNLSSQLLPFYMVLFKASSMSHVDEKRQVLDVSYENAVYVRPAYVNDTFRQVFTIKHLRNTTKNSTVVTVGCELYNQRNQLVFTVDKLMLYPNVQTPAKNISVAPSTKPEPAKSHLLSHILYNSDNLPNSNNLAIVQQGQLVLHSVSRPIGMSTNMALSTLFRWTHPSIFNFQSATEQTTIVPGGLVLAATISSTSRGLFESLHERLDRCQFLNKVSPKDIISAMTYVHSIKNVKEGIEELKVTTVGLKNIDVAKDLEGKQIPAEVFLEHMRPSALEAFLKVNAPFLAQHLVVQADRTIVRQSPYSQQRSIPLL